MILIAAMFVFMQANAQGVSPAVHSFLSTYIPNSTINSSTFYNITVAGRPYSVMQIAPYKFILINLSSPYSIVLNYSSAYPVFDSFIPNHFAPNMTLISNLQSNVTSLYNQSKANLALCITYTGLNYTIANSSIPATYGCAYLSGCTSVLANSESAIFIEKGIQDLYNSYSAYNSSYLKFESLYGSINPTNSRTYLSPILNYTRTIAGTPASLQYNQLFPPPAGFNPNLFKNCPVTVTLSSPWYCQLLSYCPSPNFNATYTSNIQGIDNSLSSLPVSNSSIRVITKNSTLLAYQYVEPVLKSEYGAEFSALVNYTKPLFYAALNNASYISSKVHNSTLASLVSQMNSTYMHILNLGINQNMSTSNKTISYMIKQVESTYRNISRVYYSTYNEAVSSSGAILGAELNNPNNKAVLSLASQQQGVLAEFSQPMNYSELNNVSTAEASLTKSAKAYAAPFSMPVFVKSIDGWFMNGLAFIIPGSIGAKMAAAPIYAALLSFIIGMVLLFLFYKFTYAKLNHKHKIKKDSKVRRSWMTLFAALFVLVLIYSFITYAFASGTNSFMPLSVFINSVTSAHHLTIVLNQSYMTNTSVASCITQLQNNLALLNVKSALTTEHNYTCDGISSSNAVSTTNCLNQMLGSGAPFVAIDINTTTHISYRGAYGDELSAGGNAVSGNACYLAALFK
ncbi:conserved hypothetical protein, membrane [mine drainage metagenome]|uniref:Uncharacterized protein n=1 Tax=mine drainage metagenome TaxID=410659 RepID=T0ZFC5_9ZZZZ